MKTHPITPKWRIYTINCVVLLTLTLFAQLDSTSFRERERATHFLRGTCEISGPVLELLIKNSRSEEQRVRAEQIIHKYYWESTEAKIAAVKRFPCIDMIPPVWKGKLKFSTDYYMNKAYSLGHQDNWNAKNIKDRWIAHQMATKLLCEDLHRNPESSPYVTQILEETNEAELRWFEQNYTFNGYVKVGSEFLLP